MQEASDRLHDFYEIPHDQVIDVGVSVDGMWAQHGHTSQFGAVLLFRAKLAKFWTLKL